MKSWIKAHKPYLVVLASLVSYSHFSHSEVTIYGQGNAFGTQWVMSQVLPSQAGLSVNDVIYTYSTVKNTEDSMLVHVQNENAQGSGYIFRSTDDWSGLPSNRINKLVATGGIPIEYWGDGSIEVEGKGEVKNASIIYNYSFDPCFDPQTLPTCPGYVDYDSLVVENTDIKDPLEDEYVQEELKRKADLEDKEQQDRERRRMMAVKEVKGRLELFLAGRMQDSLNAGNFFNLGLIPVSYMTNIPGGRYDDALEIKDAAMPREDRRVGLAQQLLHEKMVEMQYSTEK